MQKSSLITMAFKQLENLNYKSNWSLRFFMGQTTPQTPLNHVLPRDKESIIHDILPLGRLSTSWEKKYVLQGKIIP